MFQNHSMVLYFNMFFPFVCNVVFLQEYLKSILIYLLFESTP